MAWDNGEAIPGTLFRHMITSADTGGRFSAQSAVLRPGELLIPHIHRDEDEFTFVFRGPIGGRVGDHDLVVEEGGLLIKPRGIVHAMWNPTDVEAITLEFISPAGFEGFFEEMGRLQEGASPDTIPELSELYEVSPQALGSR